MSNERQNALRQLGFLLHVWQRGHDPGGQVADGALSAPQTVFCLFYAIFWGMIANAQVGWKAFNWPIALAGLQADKNSEYRPAWNRLKTALLFLALLPMLVFVLLLWLLDGARPATFTLTAALQCFLALVAANAAFGTYRIWISRMEAKPEYYYLLEEKRDIGEPGRDKIKLDPKWSRKNLAVGVGYIVVATIAAAIARGLC